MDANLRGSVDFVIITAREDENRAVLLRFPSQSIFDGKHRSYAISKVPLSDGGYYTVAIVGCIEQGQGHSQDVARDAIEDLNPQWILLVGIAGGVPADEFTLGDVVATTRLADFSVNAAIEDKPNEFAHGGGPMHRKVQNRLSLLNALAGQLSGWNSEMSIGMSKPLIDLRPGNLYGNPEWKRRVRKSLNKHFGSAAAMRPPLITTGATASSNTLVKDTNLLQQWQLAARNIHDVEMELGGVYIAARRTDHEYPVLAIRGISDIVGFRRHADWTEYACNSAAAFAYAFLQTQPIGQRSNKLPVTTGGKSKSDKLGCRPMREGDSPAGPAQNMPLSHAVRLVNSGDDSHGVDPLDQMRDVLRDRLIAGFVHEGPFTGYFLGDHKSVVQESEIWQVKEGEWVHAKRFPKRPYYQTYWGYRAAKVLAPDYVAGWCVLTIRAIEEHFGKNRWLNVERQPQFESGPHTESEVVRTVRHSARAAETLFHISQDNRLVSQTAWELIQSAEDLQKSDGGWIEFVDGPSISSLWSTAYVCCFLCEVIACHVDSIPDERSDFLEMATPKLNLARGYLTREWHSNKWNTDDRMSWQRAAIGILPEIAKLFYNSDVLGECYQELRQLITASGRIGKEWRSISVIDESVSALRLAMSLKTALPEEFAVDRRCIALKEWLYSNLRMDLLNPYDIAFAVDVLLQ